MGDLKLLILKRFTGSTWVLVTEMGVQVTGPHRWGQPHRAIENARAFVSTWGHIHVLTEEEYELVKTSRVSKPV